jgi:hypothetical protein
MTLSKEEIKQKLAKCFENTKSSNVKKSNYFNFVLLKISC